MTNQNHIVCSGPISRDAEEILKEFGDVIVVESGSEDVLIRSLGKAVALVLRGGGVATARMLDAAPRLRVIGRSGAGYDGVDIDAATARGIPVVYTPGANADTVAEGSMAMILALSKQIFYWDRQLKAGNWSSRNDFRNIDLADETLGIIGLGAIGQALARRASGFRMKMIAFDPHLSLADASACGVELVQLDELLARSRFICLHSALTEETRGLINADSLQRCRRGTFLINLARGEIIESLDCLYGAIQNGTLAGVGLDVFASEPPDISHPLFQLDECIMAPHTLGMSQTTMDRIFRMMAGDMAAVLRGKRPKHVVNPETLGLATPSDSTKQNSRPRHSNSTSMSSE